MIGVASFGSRADTNSRSIYSCEAATAPSANSLILIGIIMNDAAGTAVEPSSVSGMGITFSLVTSSITFNTVASGQHNLSLWRGSDPFPTGSIVSVAFPAAPNGCAILMHQCSNLTTAGTNGSSAVSGSARSSSDVLNNSTITATAPSATSTANGFFSITGMPNSSPDDTPGQNWILLDAAGFSGNGTAIESGYTTKSTGTTAVWSSTITTRRAAIVVELVHDNPAAAVVVASYTRQDAPGNRIPQPPHGIEDKVVFKYLENVARILNAEAYVSKFSAANPNTSGLTGIPGNLAVNVGSASTWTRLWILGGSTASIDTNGWQMVRMA